MPSNNAHSILITGAGGRLGRLVVAKLLEARPGGHVVAMIRSEKHRAELAALDVEVRTAEYDDRASLDAALRDIDSVLLVSSDRVFGRVAQHRRVLDAARSAGVRRFAYTSILHADSSPMKLAIEHRETESLIEASGLPFVFLRNGWYTENDLASIPIALAQGSTIGASRTGRISWAARADFAAAAAAALLAADDEQRRVYELAGDRGYTRADFAAAVGRRAGRPVAYHDLPEADYAAALVGAGLPSAFADIIADADACAANGALFEDGGALRSLIGRPTTPLEDSIASAVAAL